MYRGGGAYFKLHCFVRRQLEGASLHCYVYSSSFVYNSEPTRLEEITFHTMVSFPFWTLGFKYSYIIIV
jgi:hypothetical protein